MELSETKLIHTALNSSREIPIYIFTIIIFKFLNFFYC